jgi:hypothetical protein
MHILVHCSLVTALMCGTASAQEFAGVIVNRSGQPVTGVLVKVIGVGSDTTTQSGEFSVKVPAQLIGERVTVQLVKDGWSLAPSEPMAFVIPARSVVNAVRITMVRTQSFGASKKVDEPSVDFSAIVDSSENPFEVTYAARASSSSLAIVPNIPYLDLLRRGGPITAHPYWWVPFEMALPEIDIKVVNNTKETLFFTEAVFQIDRSALDPAPVLIIPDAGYEMKMEIKNFGWKQIDSAEVKYQLLPPDGPDVFGQFDKSLTVSESELGYISLDFSQAFADLGVDVETLRNRPIRITGATHTIRERDGRLVTLNKQDIDERVRKAFGPFPEGVAKVVGEIIYRDPRQNGESRSIKFVNRVHLGEKGPGAPAPPSFTYNVKLEVNGSDYEKRMPISQALKPGEFDRFTIRVAADSSSDHRFRLRLVYNKGRFVQSPPVELNLFMPKGAERYLRDLTPKQP